MLNEAQLPKYFIREQKPVNRTDQKQETVQVLRSCWMEKSCWGILHQSSTGNVKDRRCLQKQQEEKTWLEHCDCLELLGGRGNTKRTSNADSLISKHAYSEGENQFRLSVEILFLWRNGPLLPSSFVAAAFSRLGSVKKCVIIWLSLLPAAEGDRRMWDSTIINKLRSHDGRIIRNYFPMR